MNGVGSQFSATASVTGYFYQCRYALFWALRDAHANPGLEMSIERFDDVAFETDGEPVALLQTKHHISSVGNLTDLSPDLWKTLRVWSELIRSQPDLSYRTRLFLVTTGIAPSGSAASYLGALNRDVIRAHDLLLRSSETSRNLELSPAFDAFGRLTEQDRLQLLQAITILDGSPDIAQLEADLLGLLHPAAPRKKHLILTRLEEWWYREIVSMLASGSGAIPITALERKIEDLRDSMMHDSLPVDHAEDTPSRNVVDECDDRPFVEQLRLIKLGSQRIEVAVLDFYRASKQRSRWVREDLLVDDDIGDYDRRLIEAWEPRYLRMKERITNVTPLPDRVTAGESLYAWAESEASFPLRNVQERFLCLGSFHILANLYTVGWHPDYVDQLKVSVFSNG